MTTEEVDLRLKKKEFRHAVNAYKKLQKSHQMYLMTSRFNNHTAEENRRFRSDGWANGCVYCTPQKVSETIPIHSKLMVLEMNNDTNQIMAVGLCVNKHFTEKYSVYAEPNYNRFSYVGKYRITREALNNREEAVFKALDILCFTGNNHMKRGHGLKQFPAKLLYNCREVLDITAFVENMFRTRFSKK